MKHALPALLLAAPALAQSPDVSFTLLVSAGDTPTPLSLPAGSRFAALARLDNHRAIAQATTGEVFLADGASLTPIMQDGAQIPGQPAGVVWRRSDPLFAVHYDLAGGRALFHALASGPGIGNSPTEVDVIGDPFSGPLWVAPGRSIRVTRSGLRRLAGTDLIVGPVDGAATLYAPVGTVLPGLNQPVNSWGELKLAGNGLLAADAIVGPPTAHALCIISPSSIRVACDPSRTLDTDRGPLRPGSIPRPLAPADDGSVYVSTLVIIESGATRTALLRIPTAGPTSVIAFVGDEAPGAPAGFTLSAFSLLASTPGGKCLWIASLRRAGVSAGNALYLTANGRTRLILRSGTPSPGNPDGALVDDLPGVSFPSIYQVTDSGHVAVITRNGSPSTAYLYTPDSGTVEVARTGRTLPPTLSNATLGSIPAFYGAVSGSYISGGDDEGTRLLSDDGLFLILREQATPQYTTYGVLARITSPGCRADYTADGFLDFFDYDAFLECFEGGGVGGCPNGKDADFNNDDFADFFDYIDFVDAFEHGC